MGEIHRAGFAPLCAVAPALEPLVGPFTPIEKSLSPEASTQIVGLTVDFLCAVCSPEYPVVLALDDLQWADAPTLGLLKRLLGETRLEGFLLVGAYRDEEVGPSHPLAALLQGADSPLGARELITLKDLGSGAIASMLEDMLGSSQSDLPDLAQTLLSKRGGNPYFTVELVDLLWREGSLKADAAAKWKWNAAAIQALGVTANVADLLARDLGSLPHPTQDALCAMACLGSECGLGTLGLATATETHDAALLLEPALTAGVLVTSDAIAFQSRDSEARLRFCHDRMQQAALRILPPAHLALLRLEIARRLSIAEGLPDLVPRAAWCYAHAIDLLKSPKDRAIAREVFIRSAEISLISGDYTNAESHLRNAWSLLPTDDRETGTADSARILTHLHLAACRT
jgi:predicted ATPase